MDQDRFDQLTRLLSRATGRRAAIAGLAAALPLGVAAKPARKGPTAEGPCGSGSRKDNTCSTDGDCCTGICNMAVAKKNKDGMGRCRCIQKGKACAEDRNCCMGRGCVDGICGGPVPPACSPATCAAGCCSDGACVPYASQSATQCGTGGAACAPCTGQDTCASGLCTPPPPPCDATTCFTGCCDAGACVPYAQQQSSKCGAFGAACAACTGSDVCDASGVCGPLCDSTTCPDGCCDSGNCVPYANQTSTRCGANGAACQFCTGQNASCNTTTHTCQNA